MIIQWSGDATLPTGWAACDGTNGTPDLRDRFVLGAEGARATNSTGGGSTWSCYDDDYHQIKNAKTWPESLGLAQHVAIFIIRPC
jgi:hypothetical protein